MNVNEAFELGNTILTERGWDKNEHGDWVRPEDNRPARVTAVPDFANGNPDAVARIEVSFAQLPGESCQAGAKSETIWTAV